MAKITTQYTNQDTVVQTNNDTKNIKAGEYALSTGELLLQQKYLLRKFEAAELAFKLSQVSSQKNDTLKARLMIKSAIELQPGNANYYLHAANLEFVDKEFKKAERYLLYTLNIISQTTVSSNDMLKRLEALKNLAAVYMAQERTKEAVKIYQITLNDQKKLVGKNHLSIAKTQFDFSKILVINEFYLEAEKNLKSALIISQRDSSPNQINQNLTVMIKHNLANLYISQGREKEANKLYQENFKYWDSLSEVKKREIALALCELADYLLDKKRLLEVKPQLELVINLMKKDDEISRTYIQRALQSMKKLKIVKNKG